MNVSICLASGHRLGTSFGALSSFLALCYLNFSDEDSTPFAFFLRTSLCTSFTHLYTIIRYEKNINKWWNLFKKLINSGFAASLDGFINVRRPHTWNYWASYVHFNFSFTRSMNSFNILLNVIIECINIHACKHFYRTCLTFIPVLWHLYHCYDTLVFQLEKLCTFVTSPTQNLVYWFHIFIQCENCKLLKL